MKNRNKYSYLVGLLLSVNSLFAINSYAQPVETVETSEPVVKISGSVQGSISGNLMNYSDKDFSPSLTLMKARDESNPYTFYGLGANLSLQKSIPWQGEGEYVKLMLATGFSENKASLKKAFIQSQNWILGLATTNFCSPDVIPSLDNVPNSTVSGKAIQITYKQQLIASFSGAISLEKSEKIELYPGKSEVDKKKETRQPKQSDLPKVVVRLRYDYPNARGHLHLGGLANPLEYYDKTSKQFDMSIGWGVNAGTEFKLYPEKTTLKAHLVYGQGIGQYIADLSSLEEEVNTAYLKANDQTLYTIDAWGGYLAVEHNWLPQLSSVLGVGLLQTLNNRGKDSTSYKLGIYSAANLTYHLTKYWHVALEVAYGQRHNVNDDNSQAVYARAVTNFKF